MTSPAAHPGSKGPSAGGAKGSTTGPSAGPSAGESAGQIAGPSAGERACRPRLWQLAARGLGVGGLAGALLAALGPLLAGKAAEAQSLATFDSRAPVSYAADRIELREREKRVILSGDVVIEQGDLRLTAARTTVAYVDNGALSIERINATGNVTVSRGTERAQGASGVYDFNERMIVLSGGVAFQRGSDTMHGGRLMIDLASGLSSMDGAGAPAPADQAGEEQRRGRVAGTFMVPQ